MFNNNNKYRVDFITYYANQPTFLYNKLNHFLRLLIFLTVQSSEHEAITLSLNGFHLISRTGPVCPVTLLALNSNLPVCKKTHTVKIKSVNHCQSYREFHTKLGKTVKKETELK